MNKEKLQTTFRLEVWPIAIIYELLQPTNGLLYKLQTGTPPYIILIPPPEIWLTRLTNNCGNIPRTDATLSD